MQTGNVRTRTKLLALLATLMLFAFGFLRLGSEPSYKAMSLSQWLDYYAATASLDEPSVNWGLQSGESPALGSPQAKEAAEAIRQMAPKAIPFLLRWLQTRSAPPNNHEADKRLYRAFAGFVALGTNATVAIPELAKVAANPNAPGAPFAIRILIGLGPAGVPDLMNALVCPHLEITKVRILEGLKQIPPGQIVAVPILLEALKSSDGAIARDAATLLGSIGKQPDSVVPALIAALHREEYFVRIAAAGALARFGDAARSAVPLLLRATESEEARAQDYFRQALLKIAPETLTNSVQRANSLAP